jgi:hypothetical protein
VCTKLLNVKKWNGVGTVAYRGIFFGEGGLTPETFSGGGGVGFKKIS